MKSGREEWERRVGNEEWGMKGGEGRVGNEEW